MLHLSLLYAYPGCLVTFSPCDHTSYPVICIDEVTDQFEIVEGLRHVYWLNSQPFSQVGVWLIVTGTFQLGTSEYLEYFPGQFWMYIG